MPAIAVLAPLRSLALAAAGWLVLAAVPGRAATVDWAHGCQPFIGAAERHYQLPPGLLEAVALSESGQDGAPYPWALNIAGTPVTAADYRQAAALLRGPDGRPRRDVAVGCMQIHMQYHLEKFGQPEWALHPRYNVWYAAGFLARLRQRYGTWPAAIAHYHGSDPAAQRAYLCQVAGHLATTGPATRQALGLDRCAALPAPPGRIVRIPRTGPRVITIGRPARRSLMAARRVGRIIVLGGDRSSAMR